jgi:hypothetical protein
MNSLHLELAKAETVRRVAEAELRRRQRATGARTRPFPRQRSCAGD